MTSFDLSEWMKEEYEKVHKLVDALREKIGTEPRFNQEKWIDEVRLRFEHLRAHFIKHIALEEQEGYLKSVLEQKPSLSEQAAKLHTEHQQLVKLMNGIHATLMEMGPSDHLIISDCRQRIEGLLLTLRQHEDRENMLVTYAFTQDIGTKD